MNRCAGVMSNSLPAKTRQTIIDFPDRPARGEVTRFCRTHGISTSVFYKIKTRAKRDGADQALVPDRRGPKGPPPNRTSPIIEEIALSIRAKLASEGFDAGPLSVAAQMRLRGLNPPSRAALARIFTRHGVVIPEPKKRPRSSYTRFVYPAPNGCWQLDGTDFLLDSGVKRVILQVEDDNSRKILSNLVARSESGPAVIEVVSQAINHYGVPQRFLTDNALALNQHRRGRIAPLEKYLQALGVTTMSGQFKHPQTQGKNERLHGTLLRFLEAHRPIWTDKQLTSLVEEFTDYYNHHRPHQSLDIRTDQTPAEAYNATPKAPPPAPPAPPAETQPVAKPPRRVRGQAPSLDSQPAAIESAERKVNRAGEINICQCRIYLGTRRAGQIVHILWDTTTLNVFDPEGTEIGAITRPDPPPPAGQHARYTLSSWQIRHQTR